MHLPRYPVYVISKGRADACLTARVLVEDRVPFSLVVEPQEVDAYAAEFGHERLLTLPFSNLGQGSIPARNWVKDHAVAAGAARHWILDDNIKIFFRYYKNKRFHCDAGPALSAVEDFVDRYQNVAIAGLNYRWMVGWYAAPPYLLNVHVYSCMLIDNAIPQRWRGRYNEDTDLCLQVLAAGYCTVLFNAFLIEKQKTMTMPGGNTDALYAGDGRTYMARTLERQWPGVVTTHRKYQRPHHRVHSNWRRFDQPLIRRTDIDWDSLQPNNYGLKLTQVADEVKSPRLRRLLEESNQ